MSDKKPVVGCAIPEHVPVPDTHYLKTNRMNCMYQHPATCTDRVFRVGFENGSFVLAVNRLTFKGHGNKEISMEELEVGTKVKVQDAKGNESLEEVCMIKQIDKGYLYDIPFQFFHIVSDKREFVAIPTFTDPATFSTFNTDFNVVVG